jgi:diphthamide synthase (EF-2-diphthine--ammonia ligase)
MLSPYSNLFSGLANSETRILLDIIVTGAVSVQQQLRIIERMCRSYPFLKVISTGHRFQFNRLRNIEI